MSDISKAISAGWRYSEKPHAVIGVNYAFRNTESGCQVMFEDKSFYNEKESVVMSGVKDHTAIKNIHNIKSVFVADIVEVIL